MQRKAIVGHAGAQVANKAELYGAIAASILTAIYHMLSDGTAYADPGPDHSRRNEAMTRAKALARQIERLGFTC